MFVAPATLEQESRTVPDVMKYELDGMVALLTLNRPEKLNALSNELLDALMNTLDRIELDRAVRSVVITGAGRAFSAGADIAAFQDHMRAGAPEAIAHFMRPGHRMTRRVESFPKPVISAVNGLAFGGGCELVEATHIAIAAESATFSNPYRRCRRARLRARFNRCPKSKTRMCCGKSSRGTSQSGGLRDDRPRMFAARCSRSRRETLSNGVIVVISGSAA